MALAAEAARFGVVIQIVIVVPLSRRHVFAITSAAMIFAV